MTTAKRARKKEPTPLPIGWKETRSKAGDPSDAGTPYDEWKETAEPRHPREELKFWYRGGRYVRVCQEIRSGVPGPFCVHVGEMDKDGSDKVSWHDVETLEEAVKLSRNLMRLGGYS